MKYAIWQIKLSKKQIDLINEKGHDAVPQHLAKINMQLHAWGNLAELAHEAVTNGFYTHVANIEAHNPEHVFNIGNIGYEEEIERLAPMHSISVGDVIVDPDGQCIVVADFGFIAFSHNPSMSAECTCYGCTTQRHSCIKDAA